MSAAESQVDPVAICQSLCSELAVEVSKNVLEVPFSSLRNESATKSTVMQHSFVIELSVIKLYGEIDARHFTVGNYFKWNQRHRHHTRRSRV